MQNTIVHKNLLAVFGMLVIVVSFLIVPLMTHAYVDSGQKWGGTTVSVDVSDPSWPGSWVSPLASGMSAWNGASSPFTFNSGSAGHQFKAAALGGGEALAITARTPTSGNPITDMDTTFNTSFSWSTNGAAGTYDVQSAAAHELGHWLRLLHSSDSTATMYATMGTGETNKRSLETDDLNGINAIYP